MDANSHVDLMSVVELAVQEKQWVKVGWRRERFGGFVQVWRKTKKVYDRAFLCSNSNAQMVKIDRKFKSFELFGWFDVFSNDRQLNMLKRLSNKWTLTKQIVRPKVNFPKKVVRIGAKRMYFNRT